MAAGAEGGAGGEAEQPPSLGDFDRSILRLARIEIEGPPDRERLGPLPPGGKPVGVGDGLLALQLDAGEHLRRIGL
jgi:hypothetical protein